MFFVLKGIYLSFFPWCRMCCSFINVAILHRRLWKILKNMTHLSSFFFSCSFYVISFFFLLNYHSFKSFFFTVIPKLDFFHHPVTFRKSFLSTPWACLAAVIELRSVCWKRLPRGGWAGAFCGSKLSQPLANRILKAFFPPPLCGGVIITLKRY